MYQMDFFRALDVPRVRRKTCYCHTCGRFFHYLGVNRHRAMHRDRMQDCVITYTYGDTHTFYFSRYGSDK